MGNKLDSILTTPLHSQSSRNYELQRQAQHSSRRHQIHRQAEHQDSHVHQIHCDKRTIHGTDKQKLKSSFRKRKVKLSSCPDLLKETTLYYYLENTDKQSGLKEYKDDASDRALDIKIYRSYTDLPNQTDVENPLKIKVYRKSQESLTNIGRAHSMPRDINRPESSEFSNSIESKLSVATQECNRTQSRRSSSRCSNASSSANYRTSINFDDFPNIETVAKKLSIFEQFFNNLVIKYFKNLTILDQLASICVAIMPDRASQSVSLLQYLQSSDIPPDLGRGGIKHTSSPGDQNRMAAFCTTLPDFLLDEIFNAKLNTPPENQASVCQDVAIKIVSHIVEEAGHELSRLYEYQLSLIQETIAFRLMAKFAATNVFEAVKAKGKLLDRNTLVSAAMNLYNRRSSAEHIGQTSGPKWISVVCFNKELKWNIYDIFRKPALRKDIFMLPPSPSLSPASVKKSGIGLSQYCTSTDRKLYDPENSPWKFFSNSESDPMTYGYRAQFIQWDFVRQCYRLSPNDESSFSEELPWRYDDVHRLYCPYNRLVCDLHLLEYCNWAKSFGTSGSTKMHGDYESGRFCVHGLAEFIRQFRSGPHVREELKIVYKPVSGFENRDAVRKDFMLLKNALLMYESNSTNLTEVHSNFNLSQKSNGGQRDAESLRMALAQVTLECDQLCYNLQDMESDR